MEIKLTKTGNVSIAKISGDFDLGDEQTLSGQLEDLVTEPNSRVAVDLSQLNQINSMGLSALINVVIRCRMNRSRVVLVAPTPFVSGVLEVTHLDRWFEIVKDIPTAVASLEG